LKEELRLLRIEKYGPKSEQLCDAQLELLEGEPGIVAAEIEAEAQRPQKEKQEFEKVRRHPGRAQLPPHLQGRENVVLCPPEQCVCAQCGAEKQVIGYDSSEELDVEPVKYFVRVTKREKRACKRCEEMGVSTAAAPWPKIIEKSKASNRVIMDVMIGKYCNHIHLYRQCAVVAPKAGIALNRMTLRGWVMRGGAWMEAICAATQEDLLAGSYIRRSGRLRLPNGPQPGRAAEVPAAI
jgi:transposase